MENLVLLLLCAQPTYLLPNDAVEIKIWRQTDLSGWYYIDADSSLTIPLFGKFSVKNVTTDSLYKFLVSKFAEYYGDVLLDISFFYRISVFGEIKSPGYYYVKSEDNLAILLALAGGPTDRGSLNSIRILNLGSERKINFTSILKSGKDIEQLRLMPGDIVIVPKRFMPAFQEWSVLFSVGTLILQVYIATK